MAEDRGFVESNRAATARIRALAARLAGEAGDEAGRRPLGEGWNVGAALAHVAFWDRRVLDLLQQTEQAGTLVAPTIDEVTNDLALPLWAAIPPGTAAELALAAAEALDARLEGLEPSLLEEVRGSYERWVVRALHRNGHLDEIEAVIGSI